MCWRKEGEIKKIPKKLHAQNVKDILERQWSR